MAEKHIGSWNIDFYARFKEHHLNKPDGNNRQASGSWQQLTSSVEKPIKVSLQQPLNIIVQYGSDVLESFTIAESKKWLKTIARDNSMLFFYKLKNTVRRFRLKFATTSKNSSTENCKNFVEQISPYVNVQMVDKNQSSQSNDSMLTRDTKKPIGADTLDKTKPMDLETCDSVKPMEIGVENELSIQRKSISSLTSALLKGSIEDLPKYFQSSNIESEESKIAMEVKICLFDPNFPAFVEQVEKVLMSMSSEE